MTSSTSAFSFFGCLFLVGTSLAADKPAAKPASYGHLRFWNMLPPAAGTFELRPEGSDPSKPSLIPAAVSYAYTDYLELKAGHLKLALTKAGQAQPLKTLDFELKPDSYFTILISPQAGPPRVSLIEDTNDPTVTGATMSVRNYFPDANVTILRNKQPLISGLASGESFVLTGLPRALIALVVRTHLADGTAAESNAEVDLASAKRATVLIIPDVYGRFRPRVTTDGQAGAGGRVIAEPSPSPEPTPDATPKSNRKRKHPSPDASFRIPSFPFGRIATGQIRPGLLPFL